MTSAERRAMVIAGELEELRTQLEAAERARKAAEAELHETSDRVSELAAANNSLVTSKRKLEIDIQAMQVRSQLVLLVDIKTKYCLSKSQIGDLFDFCRYVVNKQVIAAVVILVSKWIYKVEI